MRAKTPMFPVSGVVLVEVMVSFALERREIKLPLDDLDKAIKPVAFTVDLVPCAGASNALILLRKGREDAAAMAIEQSPIELLASALTPIGVPVPVVVT